MTKRTTRADNVYNFTNIYTSMNQDELQDEFNSLCDQAVAMLEVLDCKSVEVMYDAVDSLYMEFRIGQNKTLN